MTPSRPRPRPLPSPQPDPPKPSGEQHYIWLDVEPHQNSSPSALPGPSKPHEELGSRKWLSPPAIGSPGPHFSSVDDRDGSDNDLDEDAPTGAVACRLGDSLEPLDSRERALDARSDSAMQSLLTGDDLVFDWRSDSAVFEGRRETFTGTPGPAFHLSDLDSPLDVFRRFIDDAFMISIVEETNRYAESLLASRDLKSRARIRDWKPVTREEMWAFFGVLLMQGTVPFSVEREFWFPTFPEFFTSTLTSLMTYDRFLLIKRCLHFVNNSSMDPHATQEEKRLFKIQPVVHHLDQKFGQLYYPQQEVVLDESLLLLKGNLNWTQKIASKKAQVGLKSYEICDSKTGYLSSFKLYARKSDGNFVDHSDIKAPDSQQYIKDATAKIVFDLVRPLFHKGHTLVMDNFYNSPLLARVLKQKGIDTLGTLRLARQFVPQSMKHLTKSSLRLGEVVFSNTRDITMIVWRDANVIALISTYHPGDIGGRGGRHRYKPQMVLDYNVSMSGIDKKDQYLSAFPSERVRNHVWYKKLFRRLLNVTVLNSQIIYNSHTSRSNAPLSARLFRIALVQSIFKSFQGRQPNPPQFLTKGQSRGLPDPRPGQHFPEKIIKRARCRWCSVKEKKESKTVWRCDNCDLPLCIEKCFKKFHTQK